MIDLNEPVAFFLLIMSIILVTPLLSERVLRLRTSFGIPDDVSAILKQSYPDDQATGFATGDIRGWVWAEVPKQ